MPQLSFSDILQFLTIVSLLIVIGQAGDQEGWHWTFSDQ